jgi:hypothetical protein
VNAVARRLAGVAVAALALAVVAGGSRWPWKAAPDDLALIRLDWRARGERVEECRPPTEEEMAGRPSHMQPREICEGKVSPYALRVLVDGEVAVDDTIHGAGAHEDRPLYVARELAVRPGSHDVRIDFEKIDTEEEEDHEEEDLNEEDDDERDDDEDERDEDQEQRDRPELHDAEATPSVSLAGSFHLEPRQVLVVTYDADRRSLIASAAEVP